MPVIFCHSCQRQFSVPATSATECPACHGGFVEEAPPSGGAPQHVFARTFTIPGGGRAALHIVSSSSSSTRGGQPLPGPPFAMPGGADVDPFMRSVLEAMMGAGFLPPGAPVTAVPGSGGGGGAGEQEWLDQVLSQLMQSYEPAAQPTARRVVRGLPRLAVRPKEAQGEPGEGQAVARAGEPCSVCHDEFRSGEEVLELPCQHGYHPDCVLPWLEGHNTCPVCRHELPTEDAAAEARRQQRGEAGTSEASGSGGGRRARTPQPHRERSGRLSDLLSSIASSWSSTRGAEAADRLAQADAAAAESQGASAASLHGEAPGRSAAAPPASASASGLRNRREAAAAAAERRLRGDAASAAPPAASPGPFSAAPSAAAPTRPAAPPAQAVRQEEGDGGGEGLLVGAVAGGLLGALVGGAIMLLGGGRRRDRDRP